MPKTILVVDDDRMSLELVRRKLTDNGYTVTVATDGAMALGKLKEPPPDLIVLDVEMPEMNGYTFISEMKKIPEFKSIPVIMLTAHEETEPLFKRHGVRGYLIKPLDIQKLLDKITEVLK